MAVLLAIALIALGVVLFGAALSLRIVKQYEQGILFRLGRVIGERSPGLNRIVPFIPILTPEPATPVPVPTPVNGSNGSSGSVVPA
jgi:regulator of protease activity HflC (stomatin/prohibitin superfamily)